MRARTVVAVAAGVVASASIVVSAAPAGQLDACAQRVIRDWYSGGSVDRVYPLPCYRAAIRALPADVLQYSDADSDIARALAFARRGKIDRRDDAAPPPAAKQPTAQEPRPARPSEEETAPAPAGATERPTGPTSRPPSVAGDSLRLASGPEPTAVSSRIPYPVIALAILASVLLLSGGIGWLAARRD